ncbi:hypothetical protein MHY85_13655 [Cellulomonas sp. ACRRI]|uniref:hypothetical protein n=1 Tax=Cellulomonas sp. ACRRI TaxID=2918188 RepID=UPI001EF1A903|nr:hypothetical protein [Cellulomonas sp. ACRRI]MCG7287014.1 hypothetical protein [Cellulomonas sp. ACRRI]
MTPLTWVLSGLSAVVLVGTLARLRHRARPGRPARWLLVATTDPAVGARTVEEAARDPDAAADELDAGTGSP